MAHAFKFFRAGGVDQVRIDTAADLLTLGELDQKLWVYGAQSSVAHPSKARLSPPEDIHAG